METTTSTLEEKVEEQTSVKCSAYFCEEQVNVSNLGTNNFRGYLDLISKKIYCCKKHYEVIEVKERMMQE